MASKDCTVFVFSMCDVFQLLLGDQISRVSEHAAKKDRICILFVCFLKFCVAEVFKMLEFKL